MSIQDPIVITGFTRTPLGNFRGVFSDLTAYELGAISIQGALAKSQLQPNQIDEVIMGCVLPAGQGQAPARQAALKAQCPDSTPCTTLNKMCGSGMKAIMMACDQIAANSSNVMAAGGMESMTQAPYLLNKTTAKTLLSEETIASDTLKKQFQDHLFLDGLQDAYDQHKLMGIFAENTARKYGFSRQQQDEFAIQSLTRSQKTMEIGAFDEEITPVPLQTPNGSEHITQDEQPLKADVNKIPTLKPAFEENGTVTAGNASSISDGAACVILMKASHAKAMGVKPLARICGYTSYAHHPSWFTTAPVGAIQALLKKTSWQLNDIDLFEINEAFAVVTLAAMKELFLSPEKVNIHGGACALGHPIGASGARIVATLLATLKRYGKKRGIASLCIGGGEATAMAIELCSETGS